MRRLALLFFLSAPAFAQKAPDDSTPPQMSDELKQYIRGLMDARQEELKRTGRARDRSRLFEGLPESIPADLPEKDGYVRAPRMPGVAFPIDDADVRRLGLRAEDVFDDEEWVRLPERARIERDRSRGYEIWHYPAGMRIAHRVYLKSPRRLLEIRFLEKRVDGLWAFGLYRPVGRYFSLYRAEPEESVTSVANLPGGPHAVSFTRIKPSACIFCHSSHGEGWYQYEDDDHAGPCGFVPANAAVLREWAPAYAKRHGYFPFTGP